MIRFIFTCFICLFFVKSYAFSSGLGLNNGMCNEETNCSYPNMCCYTEGFIERFCIPIEECRKGNPFTTCLENYYSIGDGCNPCPESHPLSNPGSISIRECYKEVESKEECIPEKENSLGLFYYRYYIDAPQQSNDKKCVFVKCQRYYYFNRETSDCEPCPEEYPFSFQNPAYGSKDEACYRIELIEKIFLMAGVNISLSKEKEVWRVLISTIKIVLKMK